MKKIATIFGTRPESIKVAPVILALRSQAGIESRVSLHFAPTETSRNNLLGEDVSQERVLLTGDFLGLGEAS